MKNSLHTWLYFLFICSLVLDSCTFKSAIEEQAIDLPKALSEQHRPQFHFSPEEMWMNDPNGMVYHDGVYHLFYQHYPEDNVWGPMHWGHATSSDMIQWKHEPIAIYPDTLGYIFSGSAVLDRDNTSGFGAEDNPPLVAIYTYHDPYKAEKKAPDTQSQGIAYSLDNGKTWEKYSENPVLKSPSIRDFRDPKVSWFDPTQRWIMTLAVQDHVSFYSSPDLREWTFESDIGKDFGAHGGVWECPDLFSLEINGMEKWILFVSINPGGPNAGSATQYFVGDYDGHQFIPDDREIRWVDYGPDDYAGVTWSNVKDRKIFLGWMSNWKYANQVPTDPWRSAMTIPRELDLVEEDGEYLMTSTPIKELEHIVSTSLENLKPDDEIDLSELSEPLSGTFELSLVLGDTRSFSIEISNNTGEKVVVGFEKETNRYFIDRSESGKIEFHKEFGKVHFAPRLTDNEEMDLQLIVDVASIELFADGGRTVMTSIFFPNEDFSKINIDTDNSKVKELSIRGINSIWQLFSVNSKTLSTK